MDGEGRLLLRGGGNKEQQRKGKCKFLKHRGRDKAREVGGAEPRASRAAVKSLDLL